MKDACSRQRNRKARKRGALDAGEPRAGGDRRHQVRRPRGPRRRGRPVLRGSRRPVRASCDAVRRGRGRRRPGHSSARRLARSRSVTRNRRIEGRHPGMQGRAGAEREKMASAMIPAAARAAERLVGAAPSLRPPAPSARWRSRRCCVCLAAAGLADRARTRGVPSGDRGRLAAGVLRRRERRSSPRRRSGVPRRFGSRTRRRPLSRPWPDAGATCFSPRVFSSPWWRSRPPGRSAAARVVAGMLGAVCLPPALVLLFFTRAADPPRPLVIGTLWQTPTALYVSSGDRARRESDAAGSRRGGSRRGALGALRVVAAGAGGLPFGRACDSVAGRRRVGLADRGALAGRAVRAALLRGRTRAGRSRCIRTSGCGSSEAPEESSSRRSMRRARPRICAAPE